MSEKKWIDTGGGDHVALSLCDHPWHEACQIGTHYHVHLACEDGTACVPFPICSLVGGAKVLLLLRDQGHIDLDQHDALHSLLHGVADVLRSDLLPAERAVHDDPQKKATCLRYAYAATM